MKMKNIIIILILIAVTACGNYPHDVTDVSAMPEIFPDYKGVTIPVGIAPMNFDVVGGCERVSLTVSGSRSGEMKVEGDDVDMDIDRWHELVTENRGGDLKFSLCVRRDGKWLRYRTFAMHVSADSLPEWGLTYRRIAPSYVSYNRMGIYQRRLSDFSEKAIFENTMSPGSCVNCHTQRRTNPDQFTFHVRGPHGATFIQSHGKREWLDTKTEQTLGSCVYPYWHPSGKYVVFSTNKTNQDFHAVRGKRIEVFDQQSDLQVYCLATHSLLLSPQLKTDDFETYPAFSPDGKWLYFCSAKHKEMPKEYASVRYNICRIAFDAATGRFGQSVDTLFRADCKGLSAVMIRPSYDGKRLAFVATGYGCFPIWHDDADLWTLDLSTLQASPMSSLNSNRAESFPNWNTTSRWIVFTSRRGSGLYTRLYIAHIDANGKPSKPFLLPQRHPWRYYDGLRTSFNTPDFTSQPVNFDYRKAAAEIESSQRQYITASMQRIATN